MPSTLVVVKGRSTRIDVRLTFKGQAELVFSTGRSYLAVYMPENWLPRLLTAVENPVPRAEENDAKA